jgi:hypothetical protein
MLSGFSLVSLPQFNFSVDSSSELYRKAPIINGVYYEGFQRREFGDMEKLYRNEALPENIRKIYSRVRENRSLGLYDYYVTSSYQDILVMKDYLESLGDHLEIIGLYSKEIEKYLGCHEPIKDMCLIGYDINADGYSAILTCFFEKSDLFKDEIRLMNEHGLLTDIESAYVLMDKYISIQGDENIEEIDRERIDIISIYRIIEGMK